MKKGLRNILVLGGILLMLGCSFRLFSGKPPATLEESPVSETGGKVPFPKPDSHGINWLQYHGVTVGASGLEAGGGSSCNTCHEENDCMECHATWLPGDHNNTWRTRTHGFMAVGNRDRCRKCHNQSYCVSCHNETAPRSHTAGWRDRHCTWCHFDSALVPDANCVVCHRRALHRSAPHSLAGRSDCGQCH